jgi:hypothetical protein
MRPWTTVQRSPRTRAPRASSLPLRAGESGARTDQVVQGGWSVPPWWVPSARWSRRSQCSPADRCSHSSSMPRRACAHYWTACDVPAAAAAQARHRDSPCGCWDVVVVVFVVVVALVVEDDDQAGPVWCPQPRWPADPSRAHPFPISPTLQPADHRLPTAPAQPWRPPPPRLCRHQTHPWQRTDHHTQRPGHAQRAAWPRARPLRRATPTPPTRRRQVLHRQGILPVRGKGHRHEAENQTRACSSRNGKKKGARGGTGNEKPHVNCKIQNFLKKNLKTKGGRSEPSQQNQQPKNRYIKKTKKQKTKKTV